MPDSKVETRITRRVERALATSAAFSHERPWVALSGVVLSTVLALLGARGLVVDTNLAALLPPTFESARDLARLEKRFGGVGYVAIVGMNAEPDALRRFARDAANRVAALESISFVEYQRPDRFFLDRALYFLESEELESMSARLDSRLSWERRHANPFFVELEEDSPPSVDLAALEEKYARLAKGDFANTARDPYYLDPDRRIVVVLARPNGLAADLEFAERVVKDVEKALETLDPEDYGPEMKVELSGRYKKRIDQQAVVQSDLRITSFVALFLIVLYVAWHFRSAVAVLLLAAPLVIGLVWTFGLAAVLFDRLNILTTFVGALLLGLGIDHGLHLLGRYLTERSAGSSSLDAVRAAFGHTGRAVILAAVTTMAGFAGVATSEFRAFREFGILAGLGLFLSVCAYAACLPACLGLLARHHWRPREVQTRIFAGYAQWLNRWGPPTFWIASVAIVALLLQGRRIEFEYDFAALDETDLPSVQLDATVSEILGRSQTPIVVLTDTRDDEQTVARVLRSRQKALGSRSTIERVLSSDDLVPADQKTKQKIIAGLSRSLEQVSVDGAPENLRGRLARLRELARAQPFERADLPLEVRRRFEHDGPEGGGIVLLYPAISLSDGKRSIDLSNEVRSVPLANGRSISAAGEAMVLADVLRMVEREWPFVAATTFAFVFIALWLFLGSLQLALFCYVPAILTVFGAIGAAAILGLRLNYLNMVVLPVLFGIGVDAGVHLVVRGADGAEAAAAALADTGRAIWGSTATTAVGFGVLVFAHHPGLRSFGTLALLGLGVNLAASLVWLASLSALRQIRAERLGSRASTRWARATADLATVGGAGYSRVAPGTLGAVAALPAGWALAQLEPPAHAIALVALTAAAIFVAGRYTRIWARAHDPQEIVLDEWIGVLIALAFVPWQPIWVLVALALFRVFDILKPGPIGTIDRRLTTPAGIVLDDVAAGLAAGVLLFGCSFVRFPSP